MAARAQWQRRCSIRPVNSIWQSAARWKSRPASTTSRFRFPSCCHKAMKSRSRRAEFVTPAKYASAHDSGLKATSPGRKSHRFQPVVETIDEVTQLRLDLSETITQTSTDCDFAQSLALAASACVCAQWLRQWSGPGVGQVTLDGQPLQAAGTASRHGPVPAGERGRTNGVGIADENGILQDRNRLPKRNPAGRIQCHVLRRRLICRPGDSQTARRRPQSTANAKTSGLKFTVEPGKNQFDIPLTSAAKSPGRAGHLIETYC